MINQEAEELMISKLKMELGYNEVNKMTQMFRDLKLSKDLHSDFTGNKFNTSTKVQLTAMQVLTNGHWPIDDQPTCTLPPIMKEVTMKWELFYNNKFHNRKL